MPLSPKPNVSDSKTKHILTLLRDRMVQGFYISGSRLPSTRDLANEFGVSRALIVEVYEQLIAEGYLEGRQGSGTYVVDLGRRNWLSPPLHANEISAESSRAAESPSYFNGIDFRPSFPALDHIPRKKWKESALGVYDNALSSDYGYYDPAGNMELRTSICQLLLHTKGIHCAPSQVIVTAGATQAIAMLSKLLLNPADTIVTEDPTATFIHDIFASTGASIIPVPVDDHGLCVDNLPTHVNPKCIFVTPSHQFPFGSILSIGRRYQLLDYAQQTGSYIIEDDYDSEFRYAGMPVHALRELDSERVIYVGTFSKNMYPALRLGYTVVPHDLVSPLLHLKRVMGMHCPALTQMILARFISSHHLEHHIAQMKRIYGKRRKHLIASLSETFGTRVKISGDAAGLHLIAELSGHRFDLLVSQLEERDIKIYPAENYSIVKGKFHDRLIIGFGNVNELQITQGISTIADMLKSSK